MNEFKVEIHTWINDQYYIDADETEVFTSLKAAEKATQNLEPGKKAVIWQRVKTVEPVKAVE